MPEPAEDRWSPRMRRVRPVYGRHLAEHSARRGRFFSKDEFTVRCARDGGRHVIAACGQLDLSSAWELEHELRRAEATDAGEIVVDLGGLEFIDSVGMEVLMHASSRARYHSKGLTIRRAPDAVQRMFARSGLAPLLPFVDPARPPLPS